MHTSLSLKSIVSFLKSVLSYALAHIQTMKHALDIIME